MPRSAPREYQKATTPTTHIKRLEKNSFGDGKKDSNTFTPFNFAFTDSYEKIRNTQPQFSQQKFIQRIKLIWFLLYFKVSAYKINSTKNSLLFLYSIRQYKGKGGKGSLHRGNYQIH